MALKMVFKDIEQQRRVRSLGAEVAEGQPRLVGTRPAITVTATGGSTETLTVGDYTLTVPNGGVGLGAQEAVVAYSGTWEFSSITGVTTSTGQDVAIYITGANALTTTASGNTLYGYTDYPVGYQKAAGVAPVRIGA